MSDTPPSGPTGGLPTGDGDNELEFRDPEKARAIADTLEELGEQLDDPPATIMHVCGSHEQSIAKFGIRSMLPDSVRLIMGPGCPVCITNMPEVDEAVALAERGVTVATYGDMLKVPGTTKSLDDARAEGPMSASSTAPRTSSTSRRRRTEKWCSSPRGSRRPPPRRPLSC
jgi:hydrogenase expression/formation protein HypD